jgi:hypothetical protein
MNRFEWSFDLSVSASYLIEFRETYSESWNSTFRTRNKFINVYYVGCGKYWRVKALFGGGQTDWSYSETPTCPGKTITPPPAGPTNLTATQIYTGGAKLTWDFDRYYGVVYILQFKKSSESTWSQESRWYGGKYLYKGGLACGTTYDWRVKAEVSGVKTMYTQSQFTTSACNAPPSNLTVTNITFNSAKLAWNFNGTATYSLQYKKSSKTSWPQSATSFNDKKCTLQYLQCGTTYDWRVKANFDGGVTQYSTSSRFTTSACPARRANINDRSISDLAQLDEEIVQKEITKSDMLLYPNPVGDNLTVELMGATPESKANCIISDLMGNIVLQQTMEGNEKILPVGKLTTGIYLISVTDEKNTYTKRFVKR